MGFLIFFLFILIQKKENLFCFICAGKRSLSFDIQLYKFAKFFNGG